MLVPGRCWSETEFANKMFELTQHILMPKQIFVSPMDVGWKAKTVGANRAAGTYTLKMDAIKKAIQIAKNNHLELIVQNRDGKIGWRNSYGNDPQESKG